MRYNARVLLCAASIALFGAHGALAQTVSPSSGAPSAILAAEDPAAQNYILGPSDVIEVDVLEHADFTTKGRISEDGTVRLPFIGPVMAAGRTTFQLGDDVAKRLADGGFYAHPIVKVEVVSYASRTVTVLGNFAASGLLPVDRPYRLSEIIARAGGVRESGANYVVLRPRDGAERKIAIAAVATGDLKDDPYVSPGDKIFSPPAEVFYVSGQIKGPGAFPMLPNLTFRMAISRGGGVTDAGSEKSVTVTRDGKKLGHIDLDSRVEPGDVIVIGERLF